MLLAFSELKPSERYAGHVTGRRFLLQSERSFMAAQSRGCLTRMLFLDLRHKRMMGHMVWFLPYQWVIRSHVTIAERWMLSVSNSHRLEGRTRGHLGCFYADLSQEFSNIQHSFRLLRVVMANIGQYNFLSCFILLLSHFYLDFLVHHVDDHNVLLLLQRIIHSLELIMLNKCPVWWNKCCLLQSPMTLVEKFGRFWFLFMNIIYCWKICFQIRKLYWIYCH